MSGALEHRSPIEIVGTFLTEAPVNLEAMARALGLVINTVFDWPENISGSITRNGERYLVKINGNHALTRRRYTLAHEIAHYILHRNLIGDGITDNEMYRSDQPNSVETEANQYAARILMPAPLIRAAWKAGTVSFSDMALRFNVSLEAAAIRMRDLHLGG